MLETSPAYLREKAAQCRRLATGIINQGDPAVARLKALADELEAKAQAADGEIVQAAVGKQEAAATVPTIAIAAVKPPEATGG